MIDNPTDLDIIEGREYKHDEYGRIGVHRVAIRMNGIRVESNPFGNVVEQRPLVDGHILFTIDPDADEALHHKYMKKERVEEFNENVKR